MSAQELYALTPLAILGLGSMALLMLGAFMPALGRKTLCLIGAGIALAAGLTSAFYSPEVQLAGGMISLGGFSLFFTTLSCFTALITLLFSVGYTARRPLGDEEYPALVLFGAFGMAFLASSTSLLGIFIGLESMTLSLYVLLASNRADRLSGEAGLKYLVVGAVSTAFFAFGLGLIYAATGTLSVAGSMHAISASGSISNIGLAGWAMLLTGLGFKASLFPFHLWAPDVYEGGPAPSVAFLSTGSKAAIFAAFLRLAFETGAGWATLTPVLWAMAALTMIFGNIAALTQNNIKRLLAYSSIAQMGYVLMAVIAAPSSGGSPAVFYILTYVLMDLGAFGVVASLSDKDGDLGDIGRLKGMGYTHPFRGFVLTICMFSLAGLPPTAGFMGKFGVFYYAVKSGYVYLAAIGIVTAIISVYYYLRVAVYLYMTPADEASAGASMPLVPKADLSGHAALALVAAAILLLGILPGGMLELISAIMGSPPY